jgi:hypothetical protein
MKTKITIIALLSLLLASSAIAQLGKPAKVFSYTGSTLFSRYGTNDSLGWTNSLKLVDISGGKDVAIQTQFVGVGSSATNNCVLVGYYIVDPGTTTNKPTTGSSFRNTIAQNGTTPVVACTNIQNTAYPWLALQLEAPTGAGTATLSNVVVSVYVKK